MKHGRNSVFLLKKPAHFDTLTSNLEAHIVPLVERLEAIQAETPDHAQFLVYLSDQTEWLCSPYIPSSKQTALVWFETFQDAEVYQGAIEELQQVTFYHGIDGLLELTCFLESQGAIEAGCQKDPLADDVFLRMRGEYLSNVTSAVEAALKDTTTPDNEKAETLLRLIAGAAGTYEFFNMAAISAREDIRSDGVLIYPKFKELLLTAIEADRDLYHQQIEACLPAAVELSVRQRVLVLADDPVITNQLRFALSHSRMETTFTNDPTQLIETLNRTQPDILVLEQSLSHFDGMDLAANVRTLSRFQALPMLVLLRDTQERTITRAVRAGIDSRLTIPFTAANLALSVLNLLSRVELSRKLGGRDNLTGLYTKEALIDRLEQDLLRVGRSGQQIAVMLIHLRDSETPRVDFLKLVDAAKRVFRRSDVLARYNEATLAVVLPGIDGRTILSISNRLFQILDGALSVETAISISDGTALPAALMADVEIRLTRALGGSREAALGLYETQTPKEKSSDIPKILIADTDDAIISLLTFFCVREGFEVEDVRNGTDLLDRLEKARAKETLPDLLILESFLPGVDGFQVLERIQSELAGRVSVIMMSVRPSEERVAKAFKLGAIDFVAKPFRVPEMIARIRNGLGRTYAM